MQVPPTPRAVPERGVGVRLAVCGWRNRLHEQPAFRCRRFEDLVRPAQLGDLTLEFFHPSFGGRRDTGPVAGVDLGALDPTPQGPGIDVEELADPFPGLHSRLGRLLPASVLIHPHRPVTGLLVVLPWCWHRSVSLRDQSLRWIQGGSNLDRNPLAALL
jgi:hypothetical protein